MTDSNENTVGRVWLIGIACFFGLIYLMFGGEREGYVNNIDSCQQEIIIKDEFYNRIFKRFICEYNKTNDGKIIDGTCYHANFDGNGNCIKLISYDKTSDITCPNGQYADYNGTCQCYSSSQYATSIGCYNKCGSNSSYNSSSDKCDCDEGYIIENNKCINPNDKCGSNSSYNSSSDKCYCDEGYIVDNNKCISTENKCGTNAWYNLVMGECICNAGYTLEKNKCVADIGTISTPTVE